MSTKKPLYFKYTNYRGETSERRVVAKNVWFGATPWHAEECLHLQAYDLDRKEDRDFVLADILIPVVQAPEETQYACNT